MCGRCVGVFNRVGAVWAMCGRFLRVWAMCGRFLREYFTVWALCGRFRRFAHTFGHTSSRREGELLGFIVKKVKEKLFGSMEGRITEGTPEERGRIRNGPWDL